MPPFLEDKFHEYKDNAINLTSYTQFLQGTNQNFESGRPLSLIEMDPTLETHNRLTRPKAKPQVPHMAFHTWLGVARDVTIGNIKAVFYLVCQTSKAGAEHDSDSRLEIGAVASDDGNRLIHLVGAICCVTQEDDI